MMIEPCVDIVLAGLAERLPWFDVGNPRQLVSATGDRERGRMAPFCLVGYWTSYRKGKATGRLNGGETCFVPNFIIGPGITPSLV